MAFYFQHSTRKYREVRDDEMPDNPNTADRAGVVSELVVGDTPLRRIMSIVMVGLRTPILAVVVAGSENAEILLCGALTLTLHPL